MGFNGIYSDFMGFYSDSMGYLWDKHPLEPKKTGTYGNMGNSWEFPLTILKYGEIWEIWEIYSKKKQLLNWGKNLKISTAMLRWPDGDAIHASSEA